MIDLKRRPHGNINELSLRTQTIYDFLQANPIGVLSTVTPDGEPHGATVYFTVTKDLIISFLTRSNTRKYDNMKNNNHVMLTVFEPHSQTAVQATGTATGITEHGVITRLAADITRICLDTGGSGLAPIAKLEVGRFAAFEINPVQIRMARYAAHDAGDYNDIFESVESFEVNAASY